MYALNPPLPPISGRPRHIAAARLVYTNNRAFSANKKKKSSRRPVQSCCDNNCLATRGVGSRGTTDLLSSLPRLWERNRPCTSWKLSSSRRDTQLLPTFLSSFALNFIFDLLFGGEGEMLSPLSLSVFEKGSPPLLPLARFKRMFVRS